MDMVKTIKLSWEDVGAYISDYLQAILGREITCKAKVDDIDYWTLYIRDEYIPLSELFKIFESIEADEMQRKDSLTEFAIMNGKVNSIGMEAAELLLKRCSGIKWEKRVIDKDYLWMIGVEDGD